MSERKDHMDALGAGLLVSFSVLLGLNQALVKWVNDGLAPLFQAGLRSACAILPVLLWALWRQQGGHQTLVFDRPHLPWGLLNGAFFSAEFALLFVALDLTSVARASLFFYIMPVWVALGAHFLVPGERLTLNKVLGLGLAVGGVLIAFASDLGDAGPDAWIGDLLALLAGVAWAGIALLTRTRLEGVPAETNLLYQLAVSGVVLSFIAVIDGDTLRTMTPLIGAIFTFQVLVIVATCFLVWFWILSVYPVSNMASFGLLSPIFGVFFGWLIFDDALTVYFVVALTLTFAGIVLVNRRPAT